MRHDVENKPGVSNLIEIMAVATGTSIADVESRLRRRRYGQFKEDVGEAVVALLAPLQEGYNALRADEGRAERLLALGAEKAAASAQPTLDVMYDRMGLRAAA